MGILRPCHKAFLKALQLQYRCYQGTVHIGIQILYSIYLLLSLYIRRNCLQNILLFQNSVEFVCIGNRYANLIPRDRFCDVTALSCPLPHSQDIFPHPAFQLLHRQS